MKKELPKIMYDQSQYTALYYVDLKGFWMSAKSVDNMEKISGYKPDYWVLYTQNLPESCWFGAYSQETLKKEGQFGLENFTDKKFVTYFENFVIKNLEKVIKIKDVYFENMDKKINDLLDNDPNKIVDFLNEMRNLNEELMSHYMLSQPQRFDLFDEKLKSFGQNEELEIISTTAKRMTLVSNLDFKLLSFAKKIKESGKTPEDFILDNKTEYDTLKDYSEKFGFLEWNILGGEHLDSKVLLSKIKKLLENKDLEKDFDALLSTHKLIHKKKKLLENKNSEEYELANIMGDISMYRFDLQTYSLCLMNYVEEIIKVVATKFSLEENEIKSYFADDIINIVSSGKKVDKSIVEERQKGFLIIHHTNGHDNYISERAHEEISDLLQHRKNEIEKTKELTGTLASWPDKNVKKITGEAFVLTTAFNIEKEIQNFKEGQILVATQTHPHVVPIMKKAKAIITDEGGITCHAAIVSRELGKPCVIGTRLGTKIFKTGDNIEVDLEKKTIKKI